MTEASCPEPAAPESGAVYEQEYRATLDRITAGEYAEAGAVLDRLAGGACRDARVRYARAVVSLSVGEYRKAGTDLAFAIALDPTFLPAYRHYGFVLLTMGREAAAVSVLRRAVGIDPGYVDAWCVLGDVYMDLCEPEHAREALETASGLEPENPEVHCKLAMFYLSRGDMGGLRREYELLRALDHEMADQVGALLP